MIITRFFEQWNDDAVNDVLLDHGVVECTQGGWHSFYRLNKLVYPSLFHWATQPEAIDFHEDTMEVANKVIDDMAGTSTVHMNFN